jgi:hypothetical protein
MPRRGDALDEVGVGEKVDRDTLAIGIVLRSDVEGPQDASDL